MREEIDDAGNRIDAVGLLVNDWTNNRLGVIMKVETFLAELNRIRQDIDKDETDLEYLTLHHVFCYVSYKMGDFAKYLDEQEANGEFDEYKEAHGIED